MINFCLSNERLCVYRFDQFIGTITGGQYLTCSQVRYSAAELKQIASFMGSLGLPAGRRVIHFERGEFWSGYVLLGVTHGGKGFCPWKLLLHVEELEQIACLLEGQKAGFSWKKCGF